MTLKAPVILGRLIWAASPVAAEQKTPFWLLGDDRSRGRGGRRGMGIAGHAKIAAAQLAGRWSAGGSLDPDGPCGRQLA